MFFLTFLEALALTSALSADAFVSAFAYGADKVKIPLKSCIVISLICTAMLTTALVIGDMASGIIPIRLAVWVSFSIFVVIGSIKILSPVIKGVKKRRAAQKMQAEECRPCQSGDIGTNSRDGLPVPQHKPDDETQAIRRLSLAQSILLAVALSLDGLGIGFGAGLNAPNFALIITLSLITNGIALALGALLGNKLSKKIRFSLSWLSGVVLIFLGMSNVLL